MSKSRVVKSRVSSEEITKDDWVVSVLNTGSMLTGHAIILLEGLKNIDQSSTEDSKEEAQLFVGQYDFKAALFSNDRSSLNKKGYISEVRCHEGNQYTRDYSNFPAQSLKISDMQAQELIQLIKLDQTQVAAYVKQKKSRSLDSKTEGKVKPILFQLFSAHSLGADPSDGVNCAQWCWEKIAEAGVDVGDVIPKKPMIVSNAILSNCTHYMKRYGIFAAATTVLSATYVMISDDSFATSIRRFFPGSNT